MGNWLLILCLLIAKNSPLALHEPAQDKEPTASPPKTDGPLAGYDGGFFVRTPDDAFKLTLEGLLQVQAKAFESGLGRTNEFELERMRLEFSGELDRTYLFHIEPNFTEADVELEEAWIGADLAANGPRLMIGRMKEPFSLEEMLPRKHLDFVTFSILNQFVPAEDNGLTLLGSTPANHFEYGAAVYNGTGGEDLNDDKDVALRGVVRPFAAEDGSPLRGLQVGAAMTYGRADSDVSGEELRTEAREPFLFFQPGSALDGERLRLGLEAAWLRGPFAIYAEAISLSEDMEGPLSDADLDTRGWYVGGSWVLTGEEKTFRGVHPERPLRRGGSGRSGPGAWQLAGRISDLGLDDELVSSGIVLPQEFPEDVLSFDIGINWYATYNARVKLHFLHTRYEEEITLGGESRASENAVLIQFQLHF